MDLESSKANKEKLLGVALNVLHQESREWLNRIAFWKDEALFFGELLDRKQISESQYGQVLHYLDKIHVALFDYLTEAIVAHQKLLSRMEQGEEKLADDDYREKHQSLKEQMDLFTNDFREFKKMVFGYARKL
ncbi:hypothetical protein EHW67_19645 [Arenibacter aquaticus]|uniref:Uncharacterized protein n=1 Tax=Arenibacter aquaticus TaxID=2489054 RepID=A0A3S0AKQ5_9FLAO|nr:hypothetical protein [Arenibacter aquaticus]RTE52392.1 hypothetical protein EHW67_19645 [Arenibacter aquaticus]